MLGSVFCAMSNHFCFVISIFTMYVDKYRCSEACSLRSAEDREKPSKYLYRRNIREYVLHTCTCLRMPTTKVWYCSGLFGAEKGSSSS